MTEVVEVLEVGIPGGQGVKGDTGDTGPAGSIPGIIIPVDPTSHSSLQAAIDSATAGDTIMLGYANNNNGSTGARLTVGDDKLFYNGIINSNFSHDEPTVNIQGSRIIFSGVQIYASDATAIQLAGSGTNGQNIYLGMIVQANNGYSILGNDTIQQDMLWMGIISTSGTADAIEWNHPSLGAKNHLLIGAVLESQGVPPSGSAGFPVGIAGIDGWLVMGVHIKNARAAFHVEDLNSRGVAVGVTASDCKQGGFTVQIPVPGKGYPNPGVYGMFNMIHTGTKTGYTGFTTIGDQNGNVDQVTLVASCFNGFDYGYAIADTTNAFLGGNIAMNCNNVIFGSKHARQHQIIMSKNTPNMMQGQAGVLFGGVISQTPITTIITKNGTNFPGPETDFWGAPTASFTHPGTGTPQFTIVPMGTHCLGYLSVRVEGAPRGFTWFGKIKWDGTTLTVGGSDGTDFVAHYNGAISAFTPSVDGSGNLQFTFFTNAAMTNIFRIEFGRVATWGQF